MDTQSVVLRAYGGPDVLALEEGDTGPMGPSDVLVRHSAIGFNFIDVFQRRGAGALPLPAVLGHEAVGVVEGLGAAVKDLAVGDRVAYATAGPGAYATRRVVPADRLLRPPAGLDDETVASALFKGLTAQYLVRRTHAVGPDDVVVVHAAAGGVGRLLIQWCRSLGACVVGVTTSPPKADDILALGADAACVLGRDDLKSVTRSASGGRLASVVYDSVGRATFEASLAALAPFGLLAVFGAASGPVPPVDVETLNARGGLFLTRPSVFHHNRTRADLQQNAGEVFAAVAAGVLTPAVGARFPLAQAAEAHRAAESRATTGAIILQP